MFLRDHARMLDTKILVTRTEAAEMLSISLRSLEKLIAQKQLKICRIGRRVLVRRDSLERLGRSGHFNRKNKSSRRGLTQGTR